LILEGGRAVKGSEFVEDPIAAAAKRQRRMSSGKRNGVLVGALAMALAGATATATGAGPESLTIPLKVVQIPGVGTKVGIEVSLGGGAPRMYTFDTGSSGFYAAYNPAWWPTYTPTGGAPVHQSYGSDLQLVANPVSTTIGIATREGVPISVTTAVGQITGASGTADGIAWLDNVAAGKAPLYGMFYGDFGSGLKALNGMFAVLPQLPGNLSSGFAVQLGCNGTGLDPKVVVGLTEAIRSRVTAWVAMEKEDPNSPPFPNSNLPTYGQALFTGKFSLAQAGTSYDFSVPAILDTGGGTTDIHQHSPEVEVPDALLDAGKNRVLSGAQFKVTAPGIAPGNGFDMAFLTGYTPTIDQVNVSQASGSKAEVNLGLNPYFRYDVVFDVAQGKVGFASCAVDGPTAPIPTLSAWAMVLLAACLALTGALTAAVSARRRSRT
jgi:hypothetical protein